MLHGPVSRPARRTARDGLELIAGPGRPHDPGTTGQHRVPPAQRRAPREPQRTLQALLSGLGAVIMLGICGLTGFFVVADERRGHADAAAAARTPEDIQRIGARVTDPRPLTLSEVFPGGEIRVAGGGPAYRVDLVHIDSDCQIATTGRLGAALAAEGCTQVVRAAITAPYGGYRVTAGVFNLADAAGAARAGVAARQLVESGGGTFAAMAAGGPGTDPLAQPLAQVGWHERGHYLVYCVIVRPDGQMVRDDDRDAARITGDLVQSYLGDRIVGRRALNP